MNSLLDFAGEIFSHAASNFPLCTLSHKQLAERQSHSHVSGRRLSERMFTAQAARQSVSRRWDRMQLTPLCLVLCEFKQTFLHFLLNNSLGYFMVLLNSNLTDRCFTCSLSRSCVFCPLSMSFFYSSSHSLIIFSDLHRLFSFYPSLLSIISLQTSHSFITSVCFFPFVIYFIF